MQSPIHKNYTLQNENSDLSYRVYDDDLSAHIFNAVSEESYKNYIIKLTENGSRWTGNGEYLEFSDANVYARFWISQQLREVSNNRIEVEVIGDHKSIVGILPGWIPFDAPCIMIGGHYDSVPGAPGANDDGTGIAAILELARVLSNYSWPLDVYFCAWNSEEIGLLGSAEAASIFEKEGIEILIYYNIDMLLVENNEAKVNERVLMVYNSHPLTQYQTSHLFADLTRVMSNNLGLNLIKPEPSMRFPYWLNSDHASFLRSGYQRVLFAFESGAHRDIAYHSPSDVWDNPLYNYTLARETVASIGASMAFVMARAYGRLTNPKYSGSLDSHGTRKYFIAISTPTDIMINSRWQNAEFSFTLLAPNGTILESNQEFSMMSKFHTIMRCPVEDNGLYSLILENKDSNIVPYEVEFYYESDIDGNNVSDSLESWFEPSMFVRDIDGDGLVDGHEILLGTITWIADSDSDEIPDGWEFNNGLDPLTNDANLDPDNDTLSNLNEYLNGTNPFNNDTDYDLIPDNWEIANGLDPLTDDAMADPDSDGISNLEEYRANLDPQTPDSYPTVLLITGTFSFILVVVVGYAFVRKWLANSNT